MQKKLLYIAPHRPERSPGQRFRFEQFIEHLTQHGFQITYSYVINEWDDQIFYKKGNYALKFWIAFKSFLIRSFDVMRMFRYDIILVYREAHFFGSPIFEFLFALGPAKLVFDFDDAIWLNDTSDGNSNLKWLKKPEKTAKIIELSNLVIAGNAYLADYAKIFNPNVRVIPTSINTNYHKPLPRKPNQAVCIGWTGSSTTIKHFQDALPWLIKLKNRFGNRITFKVIVDLAVEWPELGISSTMWNKDTEIDELSTIDIGIMPLPDDTWSKGKCGFKGIQYMALEIPAVMSPVGVNTEIITDGVNGFLAATEAEWITKLSSLIESENLRQTIGEQGRKTIEEKYAVHIQQEILYNELSQLIG